MVNYSSAALNAADRSNKMMTRIVHCICLLDNQLSYYNSFSREL